MTKPICAVVQASKTKAPASGTPDDSPARRVQRTTSAKGRGSRLSHTASAAAEEAAAAAAAEAGEQPADAGGDALGQAAVAPREAAAGLKAAVLAEAPAKGDTSRERRAEDKSRVSLCCWRPVGSMIKHSGVSLCAACFVLCTWSLCNNNSLMQLILIAKLQLSCSICHGRIPRMNMQSACSISVGLSLSSGCACSSGSPACSAHKR